MPTHEARRALKHNDDEMDLEHWQLQRPELGGRILEDVARLKIFTLSR